MRYINQEKAGWGNTGHESAELETQTKEGRGSTSQGGRGNKCQESAGCCSLCKLKEGRMGQQKSRGGGRKHKSRLHNTNEKMHDKHKVRARWGNTSQ